MPYTTSTRNRLLPGGSIAISLLLCALLASCSSNGSADGTQPRGASDAGSNSGPVGAAAQLVPESFKGKTVTAVALQDYPPAGYMEGGKWVGYMVDLTNAIAADTGLDIKLDPASFDVIIPGLQAGRWQLGMPSFAVTDERRRILDFVSIGQYATGFILPAGSDAKIASGDDLCGRTAGVLKGSLQAEHLATLSADCQKDSEPAIKVQVFPSADQGALALSSGRVEVLSIGSDTFPILAPEGNGKFVPQPFLYESALMGIGIPKASPLTPAIFQAMKDLVANGTYKEIFTKYGGEVNMLSGAPELLQ